jgi:hypothetical protein
MLEFTSILLPLNFNQLRHTHGQMVMIYTSIEKN